MDTLVLSCAFQPLRAVSWQKALGLIVAGKVEVIKQYENRSVRTAHEIIQIPSIIRYLAKDVMKRFLHKKKVHYSKDNIWVRDNGKCQYCGVNLNRFRFTLDHITPISKGGKTNWLNIVACCQKCNTKKRDMTLSQSGMKLRQKPYKPTPSNKYFKDPASQLKGKNEHWVDFLY